MRKILFGCVAAVGIAGAAAQAAPVVNGTRDAEYGAARAVQANPTSFGDSNLGQVGFANGSELDAGYATIANGRLYIFLAGNVETNFNKAEVFIDSTAGGMNRLTPIPNNQGGFNNMADDGSGNGLTFDSAFTADHWISLTAGGGTPDVFVDYAKLNPASAGFFSGQTTPTNGTLINGNGGPTIEATMNNSNTTGVTSSTAPNDAASVQTGMEFSIALADLGPLGSEIRIAAMINGSSHDFLSNQVLGSLDGSFGNNQLGPPRGVNFNQFAGNQYFTIAVPEPTSLAGLAMLSLGALRRRRSVR
jgi:hypothetical protein